MQLSVGPHGADLRGDDDKVLQAGIEYLARFGGGLLKLLPGEFTLRNSIYLRPRVSLEGSGETTVLKKAEGTKSPFARLSEWFETEVEVEDGSLFRVGDGVMLQWGEKGYPSRDHRQHTVVEANGKRAYPRSALGLRNRPRERRGGVDRLSTINRKRREKRSGCEYGPRRQQGGQ